MAKRILIVEDELDHRELLNLIFSVHGYEVDGAASGEEAISRLQEHAPYLIILDVMLPDIDGWDLCEQMKHDDASTQRIPVMMLSASAHMQTRFEGSCADDMLTKPFDDEELLSKVRSLIGD